MAASKRKKKRFVVRFQLTPVGIAGLGIVVFCVFLWMFLLGIWAGQTVLLPEEAGGGKWLSNRAAGIWKQATGEGEAGSAVIGRDQDEPDSWGANVAADKTVFSLQVATFRGRKEAHRAVLGWQARGYEAFFLVPADDSPSFRVFVGRYQKLTEANRVAVILEKDENVRAYITMLPGS